MPSYGRDIGEGLERGMDEGVDEKKTKNIFQRVGDWFKNLFGIHSPSTVFNELGGFLIKGLYNGMDENIPSVSTLLDGFLNGTKTSISHAWNSAAVDTSKKWEGIKRDLSSTFSEIDSDSSSGFTTIKQTITGKIDETMDDLQGKDWKSIGLSIVDGILNG